MKSHSLSDSPANRVLGLAALIFFGLGFSVPNAYSVGAVLFFLISVAILLREKDLSFISEDKWLAGAFLFYFLSVLLLLVWHSDSMRYIDKPSRFLLAIPLVFALPHVLQKRRYLLGGVVLGAVSMCTLAMVQVLFQGADRAAGFTNEIQFGNIGVVLAFFSLAFFMGTLGQFASWWLRVLMLLGFVAGIGVSVLSGSRGGWLFFPLGVVLCLYWYKSFIHKKWLVIMGGGLLAVALIAYAVPQTGLQGRVNQVVHEMKAYNASAGMASSAQRDALIGTSNGQRLEMWRAAAMLMAENTVAGTGYKGFSQHMDALVEQNRVSPLIRKFGHVHNEILDKTVKNGVVGLTGLLVLYLVPFCLFFRRRNSSNVQVRSYALMGVLLVSAYVVFGLTQAFLLHNNGVMFYAIAISVLWGAIRWHENWDRHKKLLTALQGV